MMTATFVTINEQDFMTYIYKHNCICDITIFQSRTRSEMRRNSEYK